LAINSSCRQEIPIMHRYMSFTGFTGGRHLSYHEAEDSSPYHWSYVGCLKIK